MLFKAKWLYKKRKIYREADPKKRAEFIEFLKNREKSKLIFVDESEIDRYLHREHCRALKGEEVYEAVPGREFKRCSIVAGKCGKNIIAPFGYTGTYNSKLFLNWVQEMLVSNLKENQIVIMDNATIHKPSKIIGISLPKDSGGSFKKTETTGIEEKHYVCFSKRNDYNKAIKKSDVGSYISLHIRLILIRLNIFCTA